MRDQPSLPLLRHPTIITTTIITHKSKYKYKYKSKYKYTYKHKSKYKYTYKYNHKPCSFDILCTTLTNIVINFYAYVSEYKQQYKYKAAKKAYTLRKYTIRN